MLTLRTVCLTALALTAASPAAAQISIQIGGPRHPLPPYLGTVGGYRPFPGVYRPPVIGVVTRPYPTLRPVPPVVTLRPNIYAPAYLSQFTPGYQTILLGNVAYHYYPALPPGATFVTIGGVGYYQAGGMWYQPYATGGQNLFLVVPPPF